MPAPKPVRPKQKKIRVSISRKLVRRGGAEISVTTKAIYYVPIPSPNHPSVN